LGLLISGERDFLCDLAQMMTLAVYDWKCSLLGQITRFYGGFAVKTVVE
jgi:hypothetical protein